MTTRLTRSTPAEQGMSSAALKALFEELDDLDFHSIMVVRHGHVVAEGWWAPFASDQPHMVFSLSKCFTSTAVGLAIHEGLLEKSTLVRDVLGAGDMTVEHLLTMTSGHGQESMSRVTTDDWTAGILSQPLEYAPGEHFVYNTGATYLLSAIVQKVTGQTLTEYLTPRLFEPLGIANPVWEQSPEGIDAGGFGLELVTEDIAKFGQLYLQRGEWNGEQLIPAEWVAEATSKKVENYGEGDWAVGYGYQFWQSRHGYRGDGAFGQFCLVLDEHDLVIATTGALPDIQAPLEILWRHLPALLTADDSNDGMPHLGLEPVQGKQLTVSPRRFSVDNPDLDALKLTHNDTDSVLEWWVGDNHHVITCGHGFWVENRTKFAGVEHDSVASAAWISESEWLAHVQFLGKPWRYELRLIFDGDDLEVVIDQNVSFGERKLLRAAGRAEEDHQA
jgi:CubicO group peptidase (beta-lactamase class C family)